MTHDPAPLFTDVSPGPQSGAAVWARTDDGCRIRIATWASNSPNGTVLLFPGRTEYIEKYGTVAADFAARGYATISVDWRGQGLADRRAPEPLLGHVDAFLEYQKDVAAVLRVAEMQGLPKPYNLVAHSMGGCIGLRALVAGLDVKSAVFTGPMWGIRIAPHLRPVAAVFSRIMPMIGQGLALTPGTTLDPYVLNEPFETNTLTRSEAMYKMMRDQLVAHPELCLAGPSFTWLREALGETKALATMPSPNIPCLTYLGTEEEIVHVGRIKDRMSRWPKGHLRMVEGGAHEVLMETSKKTAPLYDEIVAFFARASD